MGNEQNKKNTDIEIQLNHSKIHTIKVINDSKKRFMQAVFSAEQSDYSSWKQNLKNSKSNTEYLLWPSNYLFESQALCGTTGSVKVDYDNYPYLLIEQIDNRRAKKKRFDQTELWQLLFCLIEAQEEMRKSNNSRVGDIRPHNVFLNEQGNIKVANLLSWPKEDTNYQKFLQNQITYLAPEDIKFIQSSSLDNQSNRQSQIFSIGLTVLSAANLTDYRKLYDAKSFHFNMEEFTKTLHEWRLNDVFSDIFKATVCSLIEIDLENRLTQFEIQPWIKHYKTDILSRQDFVINDPPQKIINQITVIRKIYESSGLFAPNQQIVSSLVHGSEHKKVNSISNVNFPLEGSRRLVDEKRLPAVTILPGTMAIESVYTPTDKFASNFVIPGVSNPYLNNNQVLGDSSFKNWHVNSFPIQSGIANSTYIPYTSIGYKSSPVTHHLKNTSIQSPEKAENNQPEITGEAIK